MIYFLSPTGSICRIWFTTAHPVCRNCNMTSSLIVMDSSIRRPWKFSAFNIPVGIDRNREAELFIVIDSGRSVAADDDDWRNKWRSILCSRCLAWRRHDVGFSREQLDKRNQEESSKISEYHFRLIAQLTFCKRGLKKGKCWNGKIFTGINSPPAVKLFTFKLIVFGTSSSW